MRKTFSLDRRGGGASAIVGEYGGHCRSMQIVVIFHRRRRPYLVDHESRMAVVRGCLGSPHPRGRMLTIRMHHAIGRTIIHAVTCRGESCHRELLRLVLLLRVRHSCFFLECASMTGSQAIKTMEFLFRTLQVARLSLHYLFIASCEIHDGEGAGCWFHLSKHIASVDRRCAPNHSI